MKTRKCYRCRRSWRNRTAFLLGRDIRTFQRGSCRSRCRRRLASDTRSCLEAKVKSYFNSTTNFCTIRKRTNRRRWSVQSDGSLPDTRSGNFPVCFHIRTDKHRLHTRRCQHTSCLTHPVGNRGDRHSGRILTTQCTSC